MPISQIPITKGTFKTKNPRSLRNNEFAEELINTLIDAAGANVDRPALDLHTTLDSQVVIGMTFFKGFIVCITEDRKIYTVNFDGTIEDITGDPLPGDGRPTFTDDRSNLYIAGGGKPIKWEGFGATTELLGGSPPEMTHIVYLDGYLIGNRRLDSENNKVMQFTEYQEPENWPAINIFSAVADPDELQALVVSQRELYSVGEKTIEIWQNLGTSPVPFNRVFIWEFGTPAKYSAIAEENSLFFLDQSRKIYRAADRQMIRLSEAIEEDIAQYSTVTDCWSASFFWRGSTHIIFVFPTAEKAWSIDLRNNQWTEWRGFSNGLSRCRINSLIYIETNGEVYAGDFLTGKIWKFSDLVKTDAEGTFARIRTFSYRDLGASLRKKANFIRFNINRNVAPEYSGTTSETNPILEVRWKDDGKSWSEWRRKSLGVRGTNKHYVEIRRLGIYRDRQYQWRMTDPAELSIASVETDEEGLLS